MNHNSHCVCFSCIQKKKINYHNQNCECNSCKFCISESINQHDKLCTCNFCIRGAINILSSRFDIKISSGPYYDMVKYYNVRYKFNIDEKNVTYYFNMINLRKFINDTNNNLTFRIKYDNGKRFREKMVLFNNDYYYCYDYRYPNANVGEVEACKICQKFIQSHL